MGTQQSLQLLFCERGLVIFRDKTGMSCMKGYSQHINQVGARNVGKALKGRMSAARDQVPHLQDWWGSPGNSRTMK